MPLRALLRFSIRVCLSFAIASLPVKDAEANSPASAKAAIASACLWSMTIVKQGKGGLGATSRVDCGLLIDFRWKEGDLTESFELGGFAVRSCAVS